jgi:hypothetical protein
MGFLIIDHKIKEFTNPIIKNIDGIEGKNKKKYVDEIEDGITKNVCWICDKWY